MISFIVTIILPYELNMLSYCHTMQYGYLPASFLFQFTFSSISCRQNNICEHNVLPVILSSGRVDGRYSCMIRQYSAQYFREQTCFVLQALYEWDPGEDPEEQDNESILVSKIKHYINLRYPVRYSPV
jgi:hypothetical protein